MYVHTEFVVSVEINDFTISNDVYGLYDFIVFSHAYNQLYRKVHLKL